MMRYPPVYNGHYHDFTYSYQKCYLTRGHKIIYYMTLSTE